MTKENSNALQPGTLLKSDSITYRIERLLGSGGFGITYLASASVQVGNISTRAYFAIKEHFVDSDCERATGDSHNVLCSAPARQRVTNSRKDFVAEAMRLKKVGIAHPNIVRVNEIFEANDTAYYVMEYLDGQTLRAYVNKNGALTPDQLHTLMAPLTQAISYLHQNNMTHLDIKPDNVMLVTDDEGKFRPVLIDFGLSKHYDSSGKPTSTINTLGCSDGYAPAEQYAGITTFQPTADIYALAATTWFCLTGKDPKRSVDLNEGELADTLPAGTPDAVVDFVRQGTLPRAKRLQSLSGNPFSPEAKTHELSSSDTVIIGNDANVPPVPPKSTGNDEKTTFVGGNSGNGNDNGGNSGNAAITGPATTGGGSEIGDDNNDEPKPRKSRKWIIWVILLLIAAGVGGYFAWDYFSHSSRHAGGNDDETQTTESNARDDSGSNTEQTVDGTVFTRTQIDEAIYYLDHTETLTREEMETYPVLQGLFDDIVNDNTYRLNTYWRNLLSGSQWFMAGLEGDDGASAQAAAPESVMVDSVMPYDPYY